MTLSVYRPVILRYLRRAPCLAQVRFTSGGPEFPGKPKEEKDKNNGSDKSNKNADLTKKDNHNHELQSFTFKSTTSKSAPAPMDESPNGIQSLLKKDRKPYIPKLNHKRLTFEYPDLPKDDPSLNLLNKPKKISRWTRYIPKILTVLVGAWGVYVVKVWYLDDNSEGQKSNDLLDVDEFHKFIITHKEKIDDDHYIIEVHPKYDRWEYSFASNRELKKLWNGDKIWSVEIRQPDINVVRSYTPLPMYYMKSEYTRSGEKAPLLKIFNPATDDLSRNGTMCFYIKRYPQGEVSRYITSKEIGDELELRGPNIEYRFPYHPLKTVHERPIFKDLPSKVEPDNLIDSLLRDRKFPPMDNLTFYAAGTGIAPILQVLFSENPYLGHVNLHYFAQKPGELGILTRFLLFLDKLDRIDFECHYDNQRKTKLNPKTVLPPNPPNYYSPKRLEQSTSNLTPEEALNVKLQIMGDEEKEQKIEPGLKEKLIQSAEERGERYTSALEQAQVTKKEKKQPAALAIVCGPDGFVEYMAGAKDLARNQQGKIDGVLGTKKWDNSNTHKL